jgi:hypothetical protein
MEEKYLTWSEIVNLTPWMTSEEREEMKDDFSMSQTFINAGKYGICTDNFYEYIEQRKKQHERNN